MKELSTLPIIPDAIFLDRDGTVIYDKHYLCQPEGVELLPGAGEALAAFAKAGCKLFIVTNQSGIGRGMFTENQYLSVEHRLDEILAQYGVTIEATRHCPHAPQKDSSASCPCRKPATGMWKELQDTYQLNPQRCIMIGDKSADVFFGVNAKFAASILVLTGKGQQELQKIAEQIAIYQKANEHMTTETTFAKDLAAIAALLG